MGHEQHHSWAVQVPGNGYIEERRIYFDANDMRVESQLHVVWNDGTHSTQVTTFLPDGSVRTEGEPRYPDDTQVSMRFHEDGTWEIVHRTGSDDVTTWRYNADGSALVKETLLCNDLETHGGVMKTWNVRPDGSPAGGFEMWEELVADAEGHHCTIHTRGNPDGTWTVSTKVWDAAGNIVREDEANHDPPPAPAPAPPTSIAPTVPTPAVVADSSPFEMSGTSRLPNPHFPSAPDGLAQSHPRWSTSQTVGTRIRRV